MPVCSFINHQPQKLGVPWSHPALIIALLNPINQQGLSSHSPGPCGQCWALALLPWTEPHHEALWLWSYAPVTSFHAVSSIRIKATWNPAETRSNLSRFLPLLLSHELACMLSLLHCDTPQHYLRLPSPMLWNVLLTLLAQFAPFTLQTQPQVLGFEGFFCLIMLELH